MHQKIFLPFTIHLDPYLRKIIKEERSGYVAMLNGAPPNQNKGLGSHPVPPPHSAGTPYIPWNAQPWTTVTLPTPDHKPIFPKFPIIAPTITHCDYSVLPTTAYLPTSNQACFKSSIPVRLVDKVLTAYSAEDVGEMLRHIDGMRASQVIHLSLLMCILLLISALNVCRASSMVLL